MQMETKSILRLSWPGKKERDAILPFKKKGVWAKFMSDANASERENRFALLSAGKFKRKAIQMCDRVNVNIQPYANGSTCWSQSKYRVIPQVIHQLLC